MNTDANASFMISGSPGSPPQPVDVSKFHYSVGATYLTYGQLIALSADYMVKFETLKASKEGDIVLIIGDNVFLKDDYWSGKWLFTQTPALGNLNYLFLAAHNPEHFRGSPQISNNKYLLPTDPMYDNSEVRYADIDGNPISNSDIAANYDESVVAYAEGHQSAINHAINAGENSSNQYDAYAINAFYDHFMTDMFSAGHMRVPRRQLHVEKFFFIGDLFTANQMHNEDSSLGLWVISGSKIWKAYGDGYQLARNADGTINGVSGNVNPISTDNNGVPRDNSNNWQQCLNAVKASVQEVSDAITTNATPSPTSYQALNMKPDVFPPGAQIYPDSTLDSYTTIMERADPTSITSVTCSYWGDTSQKNALLIPRYVVKKAEQNFSVGPSFSRSLSSIIFTFLKKTDPLPLGDNVLVDYVDDVIDGIDYSIKIPVYYKPLWQITTSPTVSTPPSSPIGIQTFPIYILANGRLFVRIADDPINCNQYITAELDVEGGTSGVYNYDNTPPLPITVRLASSLGTVPGRFQGYPAPP